MSKASAASACRLMKKVTIKKDDPPIKRQAQIEGSLTKAIYPKDASRVIPTRIPCAPTL